MQTMRQKTALHNGLINIDCKDTKTIPDSQVRLSRKPCNKVGMDLKNNTANQGWFSWLR